MHTCNQKCVFSSHQMAIFSHWFALISLTIKTTEKSSEWHWHWSWLQCSVMFLSQFLLAVWQHASPCWGIMSSGCASAIGTVLSLQGCLRKWFVSSGVHMDARIQGFPEEYCTAARKAMLFSLTISGFHVVADRVYKGNSSTCLCLFTWCTPWKLQVTSAE